MIAPLILFAIFLTVGGVVIGNLARRIAGLERQNQQLVEMISTAVIGSKRPATALEVELRNLLVEEQR